MITLIDTKIGSGLSSAPSVDKPVGNSGDLLVVLISYNALPTVTDNNGGTPTTENLEFDIRGSGAGGGGIAVYTRVIGASEPATYNFTLSTSNRWTIVAFLVRGQHEDIFDISPAESSNVTTGTSVICDSITTLTDNAMVIALATLDGSAVNFETGSPGGDWEELATANIQQPIKVAYLMKSSAGATGDRSLSTVSSIGIAGLKQFSIKSAVTSNIKSINGLAKASIKSRNGLAIASIKSINGLE